MKYNTLLIERRASVVMARINRPEIDNKLNIECMRELSALMDSLAADSSCCSMILAGSDKWFCAGGELGDFRKKDAVEVREFGAAFIGLHTDMVNFPKPLIAAVEGDAFGGGFSLVEACDLAVVADSALLAIPEILDGLSPAMGFSGIFANVTKKQAMALGLLGKKLSANEALEWGMVNEIAPKDAVVARAFDLGNSFEDKNPTSLRLFKELWRDMGFMDYDRRLRLGQSSMLTLFKSIDGQEVLNAKDENRSPVWSNKE